MTAEWKARALSVAKSSGLVYEYETSDTAGPFDWDSAMRVANLAAIRQDDPTASYLEELLVRLDGPEVHSSGFRAEWSQLLTFVEETLATLSERDLALELCDVTSGSSVVHLRPTSKDLEPQDETHLPVPKDDTDFSKAADQFLSLVKDVSRKDSMVKWKAAVKPFIRFSDHLNRHGLSAGFTSRSTTGSMARATLTREGMDYLSKLQELTASEHKMVVSGRVVEMRSSGHVKVKAGSNRNSPAYDVQIDPDVLHGLRPYLGDTVHWLVEASTLADGLGDQKSVEYRFLHTAES